MTSPAPKLASPRLSSCPSCRAWQVMESDNYCAQCGKLLLGIDLQPKRISLTAGLPTGGAQRLVFRNRGDSKRQIDIRAAGKAAPWIDIQPASKLEILPGADVAVKIRLLETRLPTTFRQLEIPFRCTIDGNAHCALPLLVGVQAGPRPHLIPGELHFGRLEEGTCAQRSLRLENRGGSPLRLEEVLTEGTAQLMLAQELRLPIAIAPGGHLEIPVKWDTTREEERPDFDRAGFRLRFASHDQDAFVSARADLFRRHLVVEPAQIVIADGLSNHDFIASPRLENRGTVDVRITSVEADVEWIQILGDRAFLLRCGGSSLEAQGADIPVFERSRGFDILVRPTGLAAGSHRGRVLVHTDDPQTQLAVEVQIEVITPEPYPDYIGIDFGTTNSVLAIFDSHGGQGFELVAEQDEKGELSPLIPSILVFLGSVDAYAIGRRARNEIDTAADRAVRSIKRLLGSSRQHSFYGRELSPAEIAARIIRHLRHLAERHLYATRGRYYEISKAIVTVPAGFFGSQIRGVLRACREAGIDTEEERARAAATALRDALGTEVNSGIVLDEPTAAALFYLSFLEEQGQGKSLERKTQRKKGLRFLVYDHGGGTLDVSVAQIYRLESGQPALTVLATDGDNQVGGDSIDLALMLLLVERCKERFPAFADRLITARYAELERRCEVEKCSTVKWSEVLAARNHWKDAAESAKVALSTQDETTVRIHGFDILTLTGGRLGQVGEGFETRLDGATLSGLIAPHLERSEELILRILRIASVQPKEIDFVFHTGRQSLMPAIRNRVREIFPELPDGQDLLDEQNLKICVAQGAALYGFMRGAPADGRIHFLNQGRRLPCRYGLEKREGLTRSLFREVIARGTPYPVMESVVIPPADIPADGRLRLRIFQNHGTSDEIARNSEVRVLGQLDLDLDGRSGCEVKFLIDANRKLEVHANGKEACFEPEALEEDEGWTW